MIKDKTIFIQNVYYMLSYAFTALRQSYFSEMAVEQFENVHNLFAAILAKGIGQQLKQGLYREYRSQTEDLSIVRGKISLPGTIKNRISHRQLVSCEYDTLSENNLLNQILKTTVTLLIRHGKVEEKYKVELKKEMLFFSGIDIIEPSDIPWFSIRFQRSNQTYRMLISLCQFVLEGMLLTTDDGDYKLAAFEDSQYMHRLYERFILEYYRKEHPKLEAHASQIAWALDDDENRLLPVMQSDITLSHNDKILIIDAKYYTHTTQELFDKHKLHSANLYQIFTYVKNKEAGLANVPHEVSGLLLYARTEDAIQPDNTYSMSGNRISVKTLDLNCVFSDIRLQLDDIVQAL